MTLLLPTNTEPPVLTPVEKRGQYYFKRDDYYVAAGVCGGKVRTCWGLAQGARGLVTAGSRSSPQVNIVAHIAKALGIPCRVHTPEGALSPEVQQAQACGAEVVQHKAGYNSVIIARAKADAKVRGWRNIPFGMECREAVQRTSEQVKNIPRDIKRLVVPVGSGMSLAGVIYGIRTRTAHLNLPVLGVRVGADPVARLDHFAPLHWQHHATLVQCPLDYHKPAPVTEFEGVRLDPIYEAKCIPYLQPGDCLWVVGLRQTVKEQV